MSIDPIRFMYINDISEKRRIRNLRDIYRRYLKLDNKKHLCYNKNRVYYFKAHILF